MSTTTPRLGLKKPSGGDYVDINDLNGNMDKLDNAIVLSDGSIIENLRLNPANANRGILVGSNVVGTAMFGAFDSKTPESFDANGRYIEIANNATDISEALQLTQVGADGRRGWWIFGSHNMGNLKNIPNNVAMYTSINQFGILDSNLSPTDFVSNIATITNVLQSLHTHAIFHGNVGTDTNIGMSVRAKIENDLGVNIAYGGFFTVEVHNAISSVRFHTANASAYMIEYFCSVYKGSSGNVNVSPFVISVGKDGFLPLSGGTLNSALYVKAFSDDITTDKARFTQTYLTAGGGRMYGTAVGASDSSGNPTFSFFISENDLYYKQKSSNLHKKVFGEHNKPIGTYSGNGSATSREVTIATGGIGTALVITSSGGMAIVTAEGAIVTNATATTVTSLTASAINYNPTTGILTLATNNAVVNASGTNNITYQLL